jgi:hypothetical protein
MRREMIEHTRDELELLDVQLQERRAMLQEAVTHIAIGERKLRQLEKLHKEAGASQEDVQGARDALDLAKVQLAAKQAQLKEVEIRMAQANRRMAGLAGGTREDASPRERDARDGRQESPEAPPPPPGGGRGLPGEPAPAPPRAARLREIPGPIGSGEGVGRGRGMGGRPERRQGDDLERRLDTLEHQMAGLMRELHQLRQEMRVPGRGDAPTAGAPGREGPRAPRGGDRPGGPPDAPPPPPPTDRPDAGRRGNPPQP